MMEELDGNKRVTMPLCRIFTKILVFAFVYKLGADITMNDLEQSTCK